MGPNEFGSVEGHQGGQAIFTEAISLLSQRENGDDGNDDEQFDQSFTMKTSPLLRPNSRMRESFAFGFTAMLVILIPAACAEELIQGRRSLCFRGACFFD